MYNVRPGISRKAATFLIVILILAIVTEVYLQESPENTTNEEDWALKITPLVSNEVANPVVANVRVLGDSSNSTPDIVFTEPLRGIFSIAPATTNCIQFADCDLTTYNLSDESHQAAPVRVSFGQMNGQNQWIVSDIGILHPSNEKLGRVVLVNQESGAVTTVIEGIGRTVCAEPGDIDGDGDLDLTLCEFGHDEGTVSWLENEGDNWTQHILDPRPGSIHAHPIDVDSDGDLDIVAILSQLSEEVMLYRNDGAGNFSNESLYKSNVSYYGMSGLKTIDLDLDGDNDLVFTNGDTMDFDTPEGIDPNQLHGVAWLENDGDGNFNHHDITRNWGAYDSAFFDIGNDGDLDIVLACYQVSSQFPAETQGTQLLILERENSTWIRHNVETTSQYRMLSIAGISEGESEVSFVFGSHDPFAEGGELHRLATLQLQVPLHSSVS